MVAYACDSSRANQMLVSNIFKISVSEECALMATFIHPCSPLHLVNHFSTSRSIARSYQGQIINCLSIFNVVVIWMIWCVHTARYRDRNKTDTDTNKLAQNLLGICVGVCLCSMNQTILYKNAFQ